MNIWLIILVAAWLAPGLLVLCLLLWLGKRRRRSELRAGSGERSGQAHQRDEAADSSGVDPDRKEGTFN